MKFKRGIIKELSTGPKDLKTFFASQGYNNIKKRIGLSLIILIIALIAFTSYFLIFYVKPVSNSQEFVDAIADCKKVSWIREDIQASWLYTVIGNGKGDACNVRVQLLNMKTGIIDNEKLQGEKMTCRVLKDEIKLPEKDLSRCTGSLKEKLQEIIIQKMHSYLLDNLGNVNQTFFEV